MKLDDFKDAIKNHASLELRGVEGLDETGKTWFIIKDKHRDDGWKITQKSVEDNPWEHLEPVLLGLKEPTVMIHLTRIVGYWSRTTNWNPSKLAELADRQKGNYAPPEDN